MTEVPADLYARRLGELELARTAEARRHRIYGTAKLALGLVTLAAAFALLHYTQFIALLFIPIAAYIVLAVLHDRLLRVLHIHTRTIDFYQRGVDRLEDRWAGRGEGGDRFLDPEHPYARDLDLFGPASLFELLASVRTRAGEETLAAWLMVAAPVDEVVARQHAVGDLAPRIAFREQLFLLGSTVRTGVNAEALAAWGEAAPAFSARATRVTTAVLAVLWIMSLLAWYFYGLGWLAGLLSVLNLAWAHRIYTRVDAAAGAAEAATEDLELLAGVLTLVEQEPFTASRLISLQSKLKVGSVAPSAAIRRLARMAEYLRHRHNRFFRPFDLFLFWSALLLFSVENWQRAYGPQIRGWLAIVGECEALVSLSTYAYEHPADFFPEFAGPAALFDAEGLAHPLLPAARSVPNTVTLGDGVRLMILSGPNMSGKSTFIRAIGLNAVLAQCGAPVRATRLRLSPLAVAASICVLDSLSGGVSRFYAEIRKIKLITDLAGGPRPVLFLLDELLSGTNSDDRLAGTESVVRTLVARNAIGIVSTHDLALARIPAAMGSRAANFSFEDRFENDRLVFDYTLHPGIAKTRSALQLMQSIGLKIEP
ncbi:MAG: mismatch repair protein [Terracidiphilus sp.]